jgi:hypothetical protein
MVTIAAITNQNVCCCEFSKAAAAAAVEPVALAVAQGFASPAQSH